LQPSAATLAATTKPHVAVALRGPKSIAMAVLAARVDGVCSSDASVAVIVVVAMNSRSTPAKSVVESRCERKLSCERCSRITGRTIVAG